MAAFAIANRKIQLYGWDSRGHSWNGPNEMSTSGSGPHRLLESLMGAPGRSWYGPVSCAMQGEPTGRFFAVLHKLHDCGVAMVYCDESKTGPAEIVAVIPAGRRSSMRQDFAFELVSFCNFLCPAAADADLAIHEGIAAALAETGESDSLVFSISSDLWSSDADYALSRCVEKVAIAMLRWMEDDLSRNRHVA